MLRLRLFGSQELEVAPAAVSLNGTVTVSGLAYPQPGTPLILSVTSPSGVVSTVNLTPAGSGRYSTPFSKTSDPGGYTISAQVGAKGTPSHATFTVRSYLVDIDDNVADNKALLDEAQSVVSTLEGAVDNVPDSPARDQTASNLGALDEQTEQLSAQSAKLAQALAHVTRLMSEHPDAAPAAVSRSRRDTGGAVEESACGVATTVTHQRSEHSHRNREGTMDRLRTTNRLAAGTLAAMAAVAIMAFRKVEASSAPGLPADFPLAPGLAPCRPLVMGAEVICEWHNADGHAVYQFYAAALPKAGYTILPGAQEITSPSEHGAIGFSKGEVQGAVSVNLGDVTVQVLYGNGK